LNKAAFSPLRVLGFFIFQALTSELDAPGK
jgi:hypothetical protein